MELQANVCSSLAKRRALFDNQYLIDLFGSARTSCTSGGPARPPTSMDVNLGGFIDTGAATLDGAAVEGPEKLILAHPQVDVDYKQMTKDALL